MALPSNTWLMAAFRLLAILASLLGFFVLGTPLQWWLARHRPARARGLALGFCRAILALIRVRLVVDGVPPEDGAALIVANHVSWVDIPALGAIQPFCFLAKGEIARWPVVSAFAAVQGTVFVDRRRRRTIPAANRALAAQMLAGRSALLFAEGTTVAGPPPGRFHSSHLAAARDLLTLSPARDAVLVQPVAVSYSRGDAAWVGDDALLPHLWRILCRPPLTCRIEFCTPLRYTRGSDRKAMASQTRASVAAALEEGVVALRPIRSGAAPTAASGSHGAAARSHP